MNKEKNEWKREKDEQNKKEEEEVKEELNADGLFTLKK